MTFQTAPTTSQLFANYNALVLLPEIILTVFAMIVLLSGAILRFETQKRVLPFLALLAVGLASVATAGLWNQNAVFGPPASAIYAADNFSLFFKWIFLIGLGVSVLLSGRFLEARSGDKGGVAGEYLGLMMFATVGMMMVAGARDLLVVFLGIETLSIALYVLAGFARTRLMSNEAALKYFLLGAFASGFLLYGIALMYYSLGSTHLPTITRVLETTGATSQPILLVGVALVLIGLGFKAALVPFHQWTPDVYEGSPTPVTAFMATGAKAAAFAALMRVFGEALAPLAPQTHSFLLVLSVLTMTVGNIIAISQNSLKRMLAYSSISHAGYLLIGLLAAITASHRGQDDSAARSIAGVLFYLLCYALMNLGAFAVLIYLENMRGTRLGRNEMVRVEGVTTVGAQRGGDDAEDGNLLVSDLNGLGWREPFLAAALAVFLLSLAGIPPLAGFFGKLVIFQEAVIQGFWGLILVAVVNTVISMWYYLRPIIAMYSGDESTLGVSDDVLPSSIGSASLRANALGGDATVTAPRAAAIPVGALVAIVICGVAVLSMFVLQTAALQWAQEAATSFIGR